MFYWKRHRMRYTLSTGILSLWLIYFGFNLSLIFNTMTSLSLDTYLFAIDLGGLGDLPMRRSSSGLLRASCIKA